MNDVIALFCLVEAAGVTAAFFFASILWTRERSRLLDRIMARDYAQYRAYEPTPAEPEKPKTEQERKEEAEAARLIVEAHGIA